MVRVTVEADESHTVAGTLFEGEGRFVEAFVNTPLEVCEARDPKGLYKKARAGEIRQFTGVSDAYEPPQNPDIELLTEQLSPEEAAAAVITSLREKQILL